MPPPLLASPFRLRLASPPIGIAAEGAASLRRASPPKKRGEPTASWAAAPNQPRRESPAVGAASATTESIRRRAARRGTQKSQRARSAALVYQDPPASSAAANKPRTAAKEQRYSLAVHPMSTTCPTPHAPRSALSPKQPSCRPTLPRPPPPQASPNAAHGEEHTPG